MATAVVGDRQLADVGPARAASLSPSESLPGRTVVVDRIASSMSSIPAPCRWTAPTGRGPRARVQILWIGAVLQDVADLGGRGVRTASSIRATAPATCGDAIDVPPLVPKPPCSSGIVE